MNSSLADHLNTTASPNDIQYAVQVKLTPEVLQALLHAQKIGEHVSLRFAEENKTDVWTIGNQQFSCKAAREDKSDLVEVVKCTGDPSEGVPCSPQACVFKKLYFPKSTAEAHLGWKQAQASKKQQEKRVAKLLDASFNDKGGKGVKHSTTVRHTAPVAVKAAAPSRPVPSKPLLAPSRPAQRHPTPPPPVVRDPVETVPPRPAVKTLNPPKPRSLKAGPAKKDAAKANGAVAGKPAATAQARAPPRQGVKGSTPSPPQRGAAFPQTLPRNAAQSESPDITSSGSPDEGQHHSSTLGSEAEDVRRTSPQLSGQYKGHDTQNQNKKPLGQAFPRNSYNNSGDGFRVSPGSADHTKQDNSPTSFKSRHTGHVETLSPPSQHDTHESKVSKPWVPAPSASKQHSPTPHNTYTAASNVRRPSPPFQATDHANQARLKDPYNTSLSHAQLKRSPAIASHGQEPSKSLHTSPASGYHETAAGGHKPASVEHSSHNSDGHRSQPVNDRPSSQDSWQGPGRTPALNPYNLNRKRVSTDDDMPVKKPRRTPSLPHLHCLDDQGAHSDRVQLSPPMSEGAQRRERPASAPRPLLAKPLSDRTPGSDYPAATGPGKQTRSHGSEDGAAQAKRTPSDRPDTMAPPPSSQTSKPAASSSPAKRPREDSSPPSSIHTANPPAKKLVLKFKRPSASSTPSTGGSSGGLSIAAPHTATPEVSMREAATKAAGMNPDTSPDQLVDQLQVCSSMGREQSGAEQGQAGSISLADTRPSSSGSPGKAAMAYTPEQDEDEQEYSEFLSRKCKPISPIANYDAYMEAKNRYQQLHDLYFKLRHRSENFMRDLNALHSAVQSHGNTAQAAEFRAQALELVDRKRGVFECWQKALGNLKQEICALKEAAAAWRRMNAM